MKFLRRFPLPLAGVLALGLLLVTGCTTFDPAGAKAFSTGVTAAREQTGTVFGTVADFTLEDAIDFAAEQKDLDVKYLEHTPNQPAMVAWDETIGVIDLYARHLEALSATDATGGVEASMKTLEAQFNATSTKLKDAALIGSSPQIPATAAAGLTEFARLLLQVHAEKQAMEIAARTDPAVRTVFTGLAEAIGGDKNHGLRATVDRHWVKRITLVEDAFANARTHDAKRQAVKDYAEFTRKREAMDGLLSSLMKSYLALADAHSALARGREADLKYAIGFISAEAKHAGDLRAEFNKK